MTVSRLFALTPEKLLSSIQKKHKDESALSKVVASPNLLEQ
jgi:hypothetical protein